MMKPVTPRPSMRRAINAKCRDCIHDSAAPGTWREQVAACTSPKCPLFELRPGPRPRDTAARRNARKNHRDAPVSDQAGHVPGRAEPERARC